MSKSSEVVKGMGVALSFVQIFDEERKALGVSDEEFHKLVKPEGRVLIRKFAELMVKNISLGHVLEIDRTIPFNPVVFVGAGWSTEEQNNRSLLITKIDFEKVSFETCLKTGESLITGEEKQKRHAKAKHICADAKIGQTLFEEEGQKTLEYLYKEKGITWFELQGTILRSPYGYRCSLYLSRGGGRWDWDWDYYWLGHGRHADYPSLVLAST